LAAFFAQAQLRRGQWNKLKSVKCRVSGDKLTSDP
jgi:hypothetical protein